MQAVTASGTSEAGYNTLLEAVKKVIFLRQVQDCMKPLIRILHARRMTKHTDVGYDLVRDAGARGRLEWCMSGPKISTRTCSVSL